MVTMCDLARKHSWSQLTVESDRDLFTASSFCDKCGVQSTEQGYWQNADQRCLHQQIDAQNVMQDNLEATTLELICIECNADAVITLRWVNQ